jgi:hypothetical protein
MHAPSLATLTVALSLGIALVSPASQAADAVAEARRKLAAEDGIAAVAILESALPQSGAEKSAIIDLLKPSYAAAARQAEAAGRASEAADYRENLHILDRKSRAASTPALRRPESSSVVPVAIAEVVPAPADPASSAATLLPDAPTGLPIVDSSAPPPVAAEPEPKPAETRPVTPAPAATEPSSTDEVAPADAAFVARDYLEAGRIYGKLASEKRLPRERRDQWLYCRAFDVVSRINARPKSEAEWSSIQAEVDQIRQLNPNNYLGEYLRDLVDERRSARKKVKVSKAMVVRGSAPEEPARVDRPVKPASNLAPSQAQSPRPAAPAPAPANPAAARIGTAVGRWQVVESTNFRIYHADPALAARVAKAAELARRDQLKRWSGPQPAQGWLPSCEIYLYPTAPQYAAMTGQPEDSPGFSTMGMNGGRIVSRRINLRADHPTLVEAVLPHEITHVILADHFTEKQIPRWADEGISVLSEPLDEQRRRAADLATPLSTNRLFAVEALMKMDYPDEQYWGLYYAQSVSLTRFLVEQGSPSQMVQFLQESQREGYEPALRKVYKIEGFADLQRRWVTYARSGVEAVAAKPKADADAVKTR